MPGAKPPKSAKNSDSLRIAADYIDLWQDQVGALAGDHNLSEALERMLAMLNGGATTDRVSIESDHDGDDSGNTEQHQTAADGGAAADGAAAPGPASGDDMERIDELRRRIAECQSRIAALES